MAKMTIGFGVVLILLGAWGFIATGSVHPTALIPAYFGLALAWSGLLGFLGAGAMVIVENVKAHGGPLAHPVAVEAQGAMAVICLVFVGLCVRSFIAARRGGKLEA